MNRISILMYHQVGHFVRPRSHRATFCEVRRFRAQMRALKLFGYRVITLDDALACVEGRLDLGGDAVVLTFDDGYRNFADHAHPILQRLQLPATVFLVAGLIGDRARWLAADGRAAPPLLDRDAILALRAAGVAFGSHTLSHPRLTRIDQPTRRREIEDSKALLERLLGEEVRYFCYPSGDLDARVAAEVRAAGYRAALTCIRGSAGRADDPLLLPRKAISYGDSLAGFFWKLHMKHGKKQPSAGPAP